MSDYLDNLIDDLNGKKLKLGLDLGFDKDPDKYGEAHRLGSQMGAPTSVVEPNIESAQRTEKRKQVNESMIISSSPGLAKYLSRPENSAISQDDINNMMALEASMNRKSTSSSDLLKKSGYQVSSWWNSLDAIQSLERGERVAGMEDRWETAFGSEKSKEFAREFSAAESARFAEDFTTNIGEAAESAEKAAAIPYSRDVEAFLDGEGSWWEDLKKAPVQIIKELSLGNAANLAIGLGASFGGGLVAGAPGFIAGGAIAGAGIEYAAAISEGLRMNGVDPTDAEQVREAFNNKGLMEEIRQRAINRTVAIGLTSAVMGKVSTIRMAPRNAGPMVGEVTNVTAQIPVQAAGESLGETLALAVNQEELDPVEIISEGLAGGATAPIEVAGAIGSGARKIRAEGVEARIRKTENVLGGLTDQARLDQIISLSQSSKTGQRSPKKLAEAVEMMSQNEDLIYIDADKIAAAIQSGAPIESATILAQLEQAIKDGGSVSLTPEQFVSEVATTEAAEVLRPYMRMSDEGFSQHDLELTQSEFAADIINQAESAAEERIEADKIFDTLSEQMVATGTMSETTAKIAAQIIPAYATVKAQEYGISVKEAYETFGLQIRGPEEVEAVQRQKQADAVTLTQAQERGYEGQDQAEAQEWVAAADSGLDMSQEARMVRAREQGFNPDVVWYHGTNADIAGFEGGMVWGSTNPELAEDYAHAQSLIKDEGAPTVYPVHIKNQQTFNADALTGATTAAEIVNEMAEQSGQELTDAQVANLRELTETIQAAARREESGPHYSRHDFWNYPSELFGEDGAAAIRQAFEMLGYDSVSMTENGQPTLGTFRPENVRSVNAAFNPAETASTNILAQAQQSGYEGTNTGEAAEWVAAAEKGLDMSQEARMQRARDMGFDVDNVLYHGSIEQNLKAFDLRKAVEVEGGIFFTDSSDVADQYTYERAYGDIISDEPLGDVTEAYLSIKNPLEYQLKEGQTIVDAVEMERAIRTAKEKGHDGLIVRNIDDSIGMTGDFSDVYVAFSPNQVRSINAAFDPDNAGSANLLAQSAPIDPAIESRLFDKLRNDYEASAEEYNGLDGTLDGKILAVDIARELSPDYLADRTKSADVHEPASEFVKRLYADILAKPVPEGQDNLVVLTAGGTGSGKTTTVNTLMAGTSDKANAVYDTNLNGLDSSRVKINQALDAGRDVSIIMVLRDPVDALVNGALTRATRQEAEFGTGRTVPLSEHLKTHVGAVNAVQALAEEFAGDSRVSVTVLDNSFGKNNARFSSVDALRNINYNDLEPQLLAALEQEYETGKISKKVYRGFKGEEEQQQSAAGLLRGGDVGGTQQQDAAGSQGETVSNNPTGNAGRTEQGRQGRNPDQVNQGFAEPSGELRASIQLFPNSAIVRLTEASDLSSFLHESGHFFLEMERRFAAKYGSTDNQQALLKWLGAESFDEIDTNTERGIEMHEKFARGFEAYLREGKAPSPALKDAFAAFKRWLTRVYRTLSQLDVELNDDIRQVFDRLLATEEEIAIARDNPAYDQLFADATSAGMSENEWERYNGSVTRARNAAQEDLDEKIIKEYTRQAEAAWKAERDDLAADYREALKDDQAYQAVASATATPMDYAAVMRIHGSVPNLLIGKAKNGGVDPELTAELVGYQSAEEMLTDIAGRKSLKAAALEKADAEMLLKHGDILNDGTLEEEARAAIHNEEQSKVLLMELRALGQKAGAKAKAIETAQLKARAQEHIANKLASKIRPNEYYRAEVKAAQAVGVAVVKKQWKEAEHQKRIQLANHYLYRAAIDAQKGVQKWRKYAAGVKSRKYADNVVRPDYAQAMKMMVTMYDMRSKPDREKSLQSVLTFYLGQMLSQEGKAKMGVDDSTAEVGFQLDLLDPFLIQAMDKFPDGNWNERLPTWEDLTVYEMQGLYDNLRHMRYIGGQLSDVGKARSKAAGDAMAESTLENGGDDFSTSRSKPTKWDKMRDTMRNYWFGLMNLRTLTRLLDGGDMDGVHRKHIVDPIVAASNRELELNNELSKVIDRELPSVMKLGIASNDKRTLTKQDGEQWTMNAEDRFMLALYWGSESSREAIMEGDNVTESDVMAMLALMTAEELAAVNAVWRVNESQSAEFFRVSHQMLGVAPDKVLPAPFTVNGVEMTGGYMRLFYDDVRTEMKTEQKTLGMAGKMQQSRASASHNRMGSGGRQVTLNKDNIFRALREQITYMAYAEPARDVSRLLNQRSVKDAIVQKHGEEFYRALVDNISGIVGHRSITPTWNWLSKTSKYFRATATAKVLMFSFRNAFQQPGALLVSSRRVGAARLSLELGQFTANMPSTIRFVKSKSHFMENRAKMVNREAAEYMKSRLPSSKIGSKFDTAKEYGFWMQTVFDGITAYPTWMASYNRGMDKHGDEAKAIKDADLDVAETVGSGADVHLGSRFQLNNDEVNKMFTIFGSWFNTYFNWTYNETKHGTKMDAFFALVVVPVVMASMTQLMIDDEPDEDESLIGYMAKNYVSFMTAMFPFAREVAGKAIGGFDATAPVYRAASQIGDFMETSFQMAVGEKTPGEALPRMAKDATNFVYSPGSGSVIRHIEGAMDPKQDWFGVLVEGKERDK